MANALGRRTRSLAVAVATTAVASLALASGAIADPGSGSGSFVISSQSAVIGGQVTFWGAQWWTANPLSTGYGPASFKGYADNVAPVCSADGWSTRPGNSSAPPASGFTPMIVSSTITKQGAHISGDTQAIALVSVDPGFTGDPGHIGTATILGLAYCDGTGGYVTGGSGTPAVGSGGGFTS